MVSNSVPLVTNFLVILMVMVSWIPNNAVNGQHVGTAAFITNDDLDKCKADLAIADQDNNEDLSPEEFLEFLSLQSNERVGPVSFETAPIRLILVYLTVACNCVFEFGAESGCCSGNNTHVPLDDHDDQYFTFFCADINDSLDSIVVPTVSPTPSPTVPSPSVQPTTLLAPTVDPSLAPSIAPTPLGSASPTTTSAPSPSPTTLEPSASPTLGNLACFNFLYGINNDLGFTPSDVFNMVGNTLKTGLEIAAETVVIDTLNTTFPRTADGSASGTGRVGSIPSQNSMAHDLLKGHRQRHGGGIGVRRQLESSDHYHGRYLPGMVEKAVHQATMEWFHNEPQEEMEFKVTKELQNWKMNRPVGAGDASPLHHKDNQGRHRHLAFYTRQVPVEIVSIVENLAPNFFCSETDECMIVSTNVCVVLEEGDNEAVVLGAVRDGLRTSIGDGSFLAAVPPEHELPGTQRKQRRTKTTKTTSTASSSILRVGNVVR